VALSRTGTLYLFEPQELDHNHPGPVTWAGNGFSSPVDAIQLNISVVHVQFLVDHFPHFVLRLRPSFVEILQFDPQPRCSTFDFPR
jgi:hypothetical protein